MGERHGLPLRLVVEVSDLVENVDPLARRVGGGCGDEEGKCHKQDGGHQINSKIEARTVAGRAVFWAVPVLGSMAQRAEAVWAVFETRARKRLLPGTMRSVSTRSSAARGRVTDVNLPNSTSEKTRVLQP